MATRLFRPQVPQGEWGRLPTHEPSPADDAPQPTADDPPGHFVSASHASDTARFLADVQDLVRRRKEAAERAADDPRL